MPTETEATLNAHLRQAEQDLEAARALLRDATAFVEAARPLLGLPVADSLGARADRLLPRLHAALDGGDRACTVCRDLGWVFDYRRDKPLPLMLELIECPIPDCPTSGQPIQAISFKGPVFNHASKHPRTGVLMSVSAPNRTDAPDG